MPAAAFRRFVPIFALTLAVGLAASASAEEKKVLRTAFRTAETGFDPQRIEDRYSVGISENLFEGLLTYDWLARPVRLVPLVAEKVPEPEENGTRYTFRIKPGIYFADDPAFKGAKRELVAKDFEYAIKRFRDAKVRSPYEWLFVDKLVGLDDLAEKSKKTGTFDFDAKIPGLEVRDKYTISFKLKEPDFNFLYLLAMPNVVPIPREVIDFYGDDTMGHPVGTGPYMLKEWVRRSKIVLERNPNHRGYELETRWADPGRRMGPARRRSARRQAAALDRPHRDLPDRGRAAALPRVGEQGTRLHRRDAVRLHPPGAAQRPARAEPCEAGRAGLSRGTARDHLRRLQHPRAGRRQAQPGRAATRRTAWRCAARWCSRTTAVRRSTSCGRGRHLLRRRPCRPGIVGFDAAFHSSQQDFDPAKAKALLDMFGYVDRDGDGWREQPDGKPLVITYKYNAGTQESRQLAELWSKSMANVGIRVDATAVLFADLLKDKKVGKFMVAGSAWIADYPDAQNFLQLLYGPNTGQSNEAQFKLAEYDRLYEKSLAVPDGEERNRLYREMNRLLIAYAPWRLGVHRIFNHLDVPVGEGLQEAPDPLHLFQVP